MRKTKSVRCGSYVGLGRCANLDGSESHPAHPLPQFIGPLYIIALLCSRRLKMSGKSALVTGATGLLGRQVLRAFERSNWNAKGTGLSRADGHTILRLDLGNDAEIHRVLDDVK
jgi:hypothetical protein